MTNASTYSTHGTSRATTDAVDGGLIRTLFFAAAVVVGATGVLIALLLPGDFACAPDQATACDAILSIRIGFAGAGLAGGLVLAALGVWLERYGR